MRKNIVFGSFLAVFLLLMIPNISAVENTQTVRNPKKDNNTYQNIIKDYNNLNEIFADLPNPTPSFLILALLMMGAFGFFMVISLLLIIYAIITDLMEKTIVKFMNIIECINEILNPEILNV